MKWFEVAYVRGWLTGIFRVEARTKLAAREWAVEHLQTHGLWPVDELRVDKCPTKE